jgi:hypothetical protein
MKIAVVFVLLFFVPSLGQLKTEPKKALILANTIECNDITYLVEFYDWYDSKDPYEHVCAVKVVNAMVEGENTWPLVWNRKERVVFVFENIAGYVRFMDTTEYKQYGESNHLSLFARSSAFRYCK